MWSERLVGREMTRNRWVARCRRDERGAAMVEFALILPLLVLLTFGIIEFAVAFNTDSNINQAGRAGGRTAAILSTDPTMAYKAGAAAATSLDIAPGTVQGIPTVCIAPYVSGPPSNCSSLPNHTTMNMTHPGGPNNPTWVIDDGVDTPGSGVFTVNDNWPVASRHFGCPQNGQPGTFDKVLIFVTVNHKLLVPGLFSTFFNNDSTPAFTASAVFQLEPTPTTSCTP